MADEGIILPGGCSGGRALDELTRPATGIPVRFCVAPFAGKPRGARRRSAVV